MRGARMPRWERGTGYRGLSNRESAQRLSRRARDCWADRAHHDTEFEGVVSQDVHIGSTLADSTYRDTIFVKPPTHLARSYSAAGVSVQTDAFGVAPRTAHMTFS